MTVTVEIPMKLPSVANLREHWGDKAKRAKRQREAVMLTLRSRRVDDHVESLQMAGGLASPKRIVVTLTRVVPNLSWFLDGHDNLRSAFKACADAVATYLCVDDADPRIEWRYEQAKGPAKVVIAFDVVVRDVQMEAGHA